MFLKISQISQESLFNKTVVLRACKFIDKMSHTSAFFWNFQFLNATLLKNNCDRLLLNLFKNRLQHKNIYFKEHLRTGSSKTQLLGFLFNKFASLTAWRPLRVIERASTAGIFLWILCNFWKRSIVEHLLAATPRMMLCFCFCFVFVFYRSLRFAA